MEIRLEHLSKIFIDKQGNETRAVDDLDVVIGSGKLVGLLGPSGCGKSTTLFMIAGLHEPTSGKIFFGDEDVTRLSPEKRGIGLVFQNYALYPHMTIRQNIMFPLENMKLQRTEIEDRTEEIAKLVGISHLLDRKPAQLSGGQQQRVAIARALVKQPRVLLLDEPLSNLDARLRIQMREEIRRIQRKTGITTVFVTHDQEEAMSICDEIVLMEYGVEQQRGVPQAIYDDVKNLFVAKFLGTPPINLFKAHEKNGKVYVGEDALFDANKLKKISRKWSEVKLNFPICEKDNSLLHLNVVGSPFETNVVTALLDEFSKLAGNFTYSLNLKGSGDGFSYVQGKHHKRPNHKKLTTNQLLKLVVKNIKSAPADSLLSPYRAELNSLQAQLRLEKASKKEITANINAVGEKVLAEYYAKTNNELVDYVDKLKEVAATKSVDKRAHLGVTYRELNENVERGATRFMRSFLRGAIVPVVSPDNSLDSIKINELKLIFSKRFKTWNRLNDTLPSEKIITYIAGKNAASREYAFKKLDVSRREKGILSLFPTLNEKKFANEGLLIEALKQDTFGIGFISYHNLAKSGLKQLKLEGIEANEETIMNETYPFATTGKLIATSNPKYPIDDLSIAFLNFVKTEEGEAIIRKHTNFYPRSGLIVGIRPEGYEVSDKGIFSLGYQYYESIGRDLSLICEHPQALSKSFRLILSDVKVAATLKDNKCKVNFNPQKAYVFDEETGERVL